MEQGIVLFAVESESLHQEMSPKINQYVLSNLPLIAGMASARILQVYHRLASRPAKLEQSVEETVEES